MPETEHAAIIKNLTKAIEVIKDIPPEHLNLAKFKCDTNACAAGWLASVPYFKRLGMALMPVTYDTNVFTLVQASKPIPYDYSWLDEHFGIQAFDRLFAERGYGEFDWGFEVPSAEKIEDEGTEDESGLTDKELALKRLEYQLYTYREDTV